MYTIYSKDSCQQCDATKLLCTMKGVEFEVKKLDKDFSTEELLSLAPNTRSFPVVFKGEELIGGLEQLKNNLK
jgi:glutaredoxin